MSWMLSLFLVSSTCRIHECYVNTLYNHLGFRYISIAAIKKNNSFFATL